MDLRLKEIVSTTEAVDELLAVDLSSGITISPRPPNAEGVCGRSDSSDSKVAKLAVLDAHAFQQFLLCRQFDGKIAFKRAGAPVAVMREESNVGRGQDLLYGPYGEYLITVNAPILHSVGPQPGTMKLWYANPYEDKRVGDVHWGTLLGQRDIPILNTTFSLDGSRIAAFSADGYIHLWSVYPEQRVDFSIRAEDYFNGYRHLSVQARRLINDTETTPQEFVTLAESDYRIRLDRNEIRDIDSWLMQGGPPTESIKAESLRPGSIALQSFGTRDELPNLYFQVREEYIGEESKYNPWFENTELQELVDDLVWGNHVAEGELCERYMAAVQYDPLLLSGTHIRWQLKALRSSNEIERRRAWTLLGLSGDLSRLSQLKSQIADEPAVNVQMIAKWALDFLKQHGRDLSLTGSLASTPGDAMHQLLVFAPKPCLPAIRTLIRVVPWEPDFGKTIEQFLLTIPSPFRQGCLPG